MPSRSSASGQVSRALSVSTESGRLAVSRRDAHRIPIRTRRNPPENVRERWGGWGGSIVINDLDHRITMAYMMNRMQAGLVGNDTSVALYTALRSILD